MICTKLEIPFTDYFQVHKGMISLWVWKISMFCKGRWAISSVLLKFHTQMKYLWRQHRTKEADNSLIMTVNDQWGELIYRIAMRKMRRCVFAWFWSLTHSTQSIFISRNFSRLMAITIDKNKLITISKSKGVRFQLAIHRHIVIFVVCSNIDSTEGVESADSELPAASAVCQFSMSDIREAFNGPFIKRINNAWRPYDPRLEGDNIVPSPYSVSTISS